MAIHLGRVEQLSFADVSQTFTSRDTMLYALGLGYGADPLDERELSFVYEKQLRAVPSMVSILCQPGFWARDPQFGIDWVKVLHAEQSFTMLGALPADGTLIGNVRISGVEDKGAEKGALLHQEKTLRDHDGTPIAKVRTTLFLRGDGGQGGFGDAVPTAPALPDRACDRVLMVATSPRAALIYRLSGDWNPLHADPSIARSAGFERPIMHGLCTLGMGCRVLLANYCDQEPSRLKSMFVRFSRPVYPGEHLRFEFFEEGPLIHFRAIAVEREVLVLDRCVAEIG